MPIGYIALGMIFGAFAAGYGLSFWLTLAIYSGVGTLAVLLPIWLMLWREVRDTSPENHPAEVA